jgi:hypothetical protein
MIVDIQGVTTCPSYGFSDLDSQLRNFLKLLPISLYLKSRERGMFIILSIIA